MTLEDDYKQDTTTTNTTTSLMRPLSLSLLSQFQERESAIL